MSGMVETIDGGSATLVELRRVGIAALVTALGPAGMARFLQQWDRRDVDYTAQRDAILGEPTVDGLMAEVLRRKGSPEI